MIFIQCPRNKRALLLEQGEIRKPQNVLFSLPQLAKCIYYHL